MNETNGQPQWPPLRLDQDNWDVLSAARPYSDEIPDVHFVPVTEGEATELSDDEPEPPKHRAPASMRLDVFYSVLSPGANRAFKHANIHTVEDIRYAYAQLVTEENDGPLRDAMEKLQTSSGATEPSEEDTEHMTEFVRLLVV